VESILRTKHLTKHYRRQAAVQDLSLTIRPGEIYGFLGQNGAGKTTTLRMILGLVRPTAGEIELFGERVRGNRRRFLERIGEIIENPGFYRDLSGEENLEIHRRLMGMENRECIAEALETVGLLNEKNRQVKTYSLGMKQRLGIARALLHHPELLILDEPTNGLDPVGIKEVRQLLLDLSAKRQITVLVSSHILSEIQQMATRIGILHQGRLVEEIDYDVLQKKNRHCILVRVSDEKKAAYILEEELQISDYQVPERGVLRIYERLNESARVNRLLVERGLEVREISIMRDSLEDYFVKLTGGGLNV
jgi:bacitracin transport system ATP-binding protein